jgi:hypothetical protein
VPAAPASTGLSADGGIELPQPGEGLFQRSPYPSISAR